MSPPTSLKMNYWIYGSGTGAAGWRRREKWSLGKKKTKSISVWQSCPFRAKLRSRSSTCIPSPGGRTRAGMVPSTSQPHLYFKAPLSLGWTWLCLHLLCTPRCGHCVGSRGHWAPQVPGRLHATQLSPGPWQTQLTWTSPGCWEKIEAARKTQTNKEADSEEKEEL